MNLDLYKHIYLLGIGGIGIGMIYSLLTRAAARPQRTRSRPRQLGS